MDVHVHTFTSAAAARAFKLCSLLTVTFVHAWALGARDPHRAWPGACASAVSPEFTHVINDPILKILSRVELLKPPISPKIRLF